ncbi:MAG: glycosyltransferase family 4 protein [Candidatus Roizmanbacteria bacterium]
MTKTPLRIGFDLDGVLLYNPARIARYPVKLIKKFLHKKVKRFYIPQSPFERFLWRIFHFSSLFLAPGYMIIKELSDAGLIEPYLVTARYKFLEADFKWWLKHMPIKDLFKGIYINELNEQPHLYKEKMMKKLKLDYFIDDNYDIVEHLTETTPTKVFWVCNILDRNIDYFYKFAGLKDALLYLKNHVLKKKVQERKFLLLTEFFYPHWTGIAKAFNRLASDLQVHGYSVSVLTTQFDKKLPEYEVLPDKIEIFRTPYAFKLSRSYYSFKTLSMAWSLIKTHDHIIINSPHSNILPLSIMTKLLGKKLSLFHQGDLSLPRKTGDIIVHFLLERIFDCMSIPAGALADTVSTYTDDYAKSSRFLKYFLYKFKPYIPKTVLSEEKPSPKFKSRLDKLKKDHVLIGFAGRFVEEKGFDILLDSMDAVQEVIPKAKFVFAGVNKMEYEKFYELLQAKIFAHEDDLVFLGLLKEPELAYFHKQNDVFVVSSRSDCFPLTQMEAVRAGTPLVVTDIPGARMIVKSTHCGKIVPPENSTKLAAAIIDVIQKRDTYKVHIPAAQAFLDRYEKPPYY